jgi:uncharacterized protein YdeI (YjbR/CyaY-like superfamily)
MNMGIEELERVEVSSVAELHAWFLAHHDQPEGIWLVTHRKSVPERYVSARAVLDEALCFGWMDGARRKVDDERTMQLLSPRRAQHWARSYKDRVAVLTREGRMHPAGLAAVERAKADGGWTFMDDVDALVIPEDLREAFDARPPAAQHFAAFPPSAQRQILRWIKLAKTTETRAKRVLLTAERAAVNERAYPG